MLRTVLIFFLIIGFAGIVMLPLVGSANNSNTNSQDDVSKVICNVILFVQKLGLPIMTGVILGSSIMAIFGRLPWPAIVMLVVFTAIFFGASKLIGKFVHGINNGISSGTECGASSGK